MVAPKARKESIVASISLEEWEITIVLGLVARAAAMSARWAWALAGMDGIVPDKGILETCCIGVLSSIWAF